MSYAWLMVAVTFLPHFLAMGFVFYSAGVFLEPLAEEFGVGRSEISLIGSFASVGGAVAAPFLGRWLATGSIRNAMSVGCLAMGGAFLAGSQAGALWHLYAVFAPLATIGMMTMGGVTTQALVVNWFAEKRAMALGISMFGISSSGFVIPPIVSAITQADGWRVAYEVMGIACVLITPIVFFTVVSRPEERDSGSAASQPQTSAPESEAPAFSTRDALRQRNLWTIAIPSGLSFMVTTAVTVHVFAAGTDAGLEPSDAALLITAVAGGAAGAKFFFGWLAGRIGELRSIQVSLAAQGVGVLLLNTASGLEMFLAASLVTGIGLGGIAPLSAALLAHAFGQKAFGPMMGLMMPIMIVFQVIGAPLAGAVHDLTKSYAIAWNTSALSMGIAILVVAMTRLPRPHGGEVGQVGEEPDTQQV